MKCASTPATQARRGGAAALALVFAAMHFGAGLHRATVEHETCPHGEFVHRDAHGSASGVERTQLDALASLRGLDVGAEDHEHCSTNFRHEEFGVAVTHVDSVREAVELEALERATLALSSPAPQVALYLLAPKQSPPRA